jgi:hypothetical protein
MKLLDDHLRSDYAGAAVLTLDEALRSGVGPRAAMDRALDAAGVPELAAKADQLEGELAETRAALAEERAERERLVTALSPLQPLHRTPRHGRVVGVPLATAAAAMGHASVRR